jgi:hypothetical protein
VAAAVSARGLRCGRIHTLILDPTRALKDSKAGRGAPKSPAEGGGEGHGLERFN